MGASALGAVDAAAPDGEHRGQWELVPPVPGQGALDVPVPHDALDHGPVVEHDVVQGFQGVCEAVVVDLAIGILPDQIGDLGQVASLREGLHEPDRGDLCRVPLHHQVHLRPAYELVREVGRREASELHLGVGMVLLDYLRQLQRPMCVRHPVQVDGEHLGVQLPDPLLGVELLALEHLDRDVHDPGLEARRFEVRRDRHEPHGIHLEHGGRGDHIADGAVEYRLLPEVVHAGSVHEDNV